MSNSTPIEESPLLGYSKDHYGHARAVAGKENAVATALSSEELSHAQLVLIMSSVWVSVTNRCDETDADGP